jgi:cell shape-determining protein MreD
MAMSTFQSFKHEVVQFAELSKDALHIYVGLAVFLVGAAIARKGLRSAIALLVVLAVAFVGEVLDLRDEYRTHERLQWWASLHDLLNTCFWPLILWLLARYTRILK